MFILFWWKKIISCIFPVTHKVSLNEVKDVSRMWNVQAKRWCKEETFFLLFSAFDQEGQFLWQHQNAKRFFWRFNAHKNHKWTHKGCRTHESFRISRLFFNEVSEKSAPSNENSYFNLPLKIFCMIFKTGLKALKIKR